MSWAYKKVKWATFPQLLVVRKLSHLNQVCLNRRILKGHIFLTYLYITISNINTAEKWSLFLRLAEHWSRDHLKSSSSPITPQLGLNFYFYPTTCGVIRNQCQKYVDPYLQTSKILKCKDF